MTRMFEGKLYRSAPETRMQGCDGCAFNPTVQACAKFHRAYPDVCCINDEVIYIEVKESEDAPS